MEFTAAIERLARALPAGSPPLPVGHPAVGRIGLAVPGRGFTPRGISGRTLRALLKDEERYLADPRLMLRERGAVTCWDDVLNARANGRADDFLGWKSALAGAVGANWSSFLTAGGIPAGMTFTSIPGGASCNSTTTGAVPLGNPGPGLKKYLLNLGCNCTNNSHVIMLVDLLVSAGGIDANTASPQIIDTTALTRYTDGVGVMATLEVTTALGGVAANCAVSYTNQAGLSGRSTVNTAMVTSCIVNRLQPGGAMPAMRLAAGDTGMRSVQTLTFSAAMGAGACALHLYRPLVLIPTILSTTFVERSTPGMLGGLTELVAEAGGAVGCLSFFILAGATGTGTFNYFLQTCAG